MSICPLCPGETKLKPLFKCGDRFKDVSANDYQIFRCLNCGLTFLNPQPPVAEIYSNEKYDPFLSTKESKSLFDTAYAFARTYALDWKKRLVRRLAKPGGKIMDGGCGTGEFLSHISDDYTVEGFEPEAKASQWAREKYGLNVHSGDLHSVKFDNTDFDLITLWHVLEHVPDPVKDLRRLRELLADDGKLLIALPNIRSFDARLYKRCWVAIDAPRHLWHFSKPQIEKLLRQTGFTLKKTGMLPLDPFYNTLLSEQALLKGTGRQQLFFSPFRIPIAIAGSLAYGALTGVHSSNYYICEKVS